MQVDSLMMSNKWAAGRVPPLDLTDHSLCSTDEADLRWQTMKPDHQTLSSVANLLNLPRKQAIYQDKYENNYTQTSFDQTFKYDFVLGADGLPIGKWRFDCYFKFHEVQLHFRFADPRDWTRADVWSWLTNLALNEGLQPNADLAQKFPMNGKALCLMSLDMYLARVPHGGKMLYRDFRLRLARAMSL